MRFFLVIATVHGVSTLLQPPLLRSTPLQPALPHSALSHPRCALRMVETIEGTLPPPPSSSDGGDKRKQIAKARRAVAQEGTGGLRVRKGAKRTEAKAASSAKGFGQKPGLNYDRRPKHTVCCACGSGDSYGDCCARVHERGSTDSTEALVRARFSAFKYRMPDFLMKTTDPESPEYDADAKAWKRSLLGFCDDFDFQSLEVGEVEKVDDTAPVARVAFRVNFCQKGTLNLMVLCEQSSFRRAEDGTWLYADGQVNYEAQG